jgi:hypothetical protein
MHSLTAYIDAVEQPARLAIPTCAGCGSLREFPTCAGICSEHKLELVSGGEYDALAAAAAARRVRIGALQEVVDELARAAPAGPRWDDDYRTARETARAALRRVRREARATEDDLPAADRLIVWRCPDCGGLDFPQPCIGVCIWRPADWVQAAVYGSERARALDERQLEHALIGLLDRVAFVTPNRGEAERNWRALSSQARQLRSRPTAAPPRAR